MGEGDKEIGFPECLYVPTSMRDATKIKCQSDNRLQEHLQNVPTQAAWYRFPSNAIPDVESEEIMQVTPVVAFLVYIGFTKDLLTEEVYEHILSLADQAPAWIKHSKAFLYACVVKQNTCDPKTHIDQGTYLCMAPPEAKKWASQRFAQLYSITPSTPAASSQSTSTAGQATQ
eukprot:12059450-Ditylum_brightwellii.AAC.1